MVKLAGAVNVALFTEAEIAEAEPAWLPQFPLVPHPDVVAIRKTAVTFNNLHFSALFIFISLFHSCFLVHSNITQYHPIPSLTQWGFGEAQNIA
jgi:hypothetical protein